MTVLTGRGEEVEVRMGRKERGKKRMEKGKE